MKKNESEVIKLKNENSHKNTKISMLTQKIEALSKEVNGLNKEVNLS